MFTPAISWLCLAAYAGHLACDAITGGIALLHPFSATIQGRNLLPYSLWIVSDVALLLYLYFVYRWFPLRRKIKERANIRATG